MRINVLNSPLADIPRVKTLVACGGKADVIKINLNVTILSIADVRTEIVFAQTTS